MIWDSIVDDGIRNQWTSAVGHRREDYLRSNIIRGATEGSGGDSIQDALFTHAKVCQFTVALRIQQNIVQLQVSEQEQKTKRISPTSLDHWQEQISHVCLGWGCVGGDWTEALPVDDSMQVQEHERRSDLGSVEAWARLIKLPRPLDLKHEVSPVHILHHKEQAVLTTKQNTGQTDMRRVWIWTEFMVNILE